MLLSLLQADAPKAAIIFVNDQVNYHPSGMGGFKNICMESIYTLSDAESRLNLWFYTRIVAVLVDVPEMTCAVRKSETSWKHSKHCNSCRVSGTNEDPP